MGEMADYANDVNDWENAPYVYEPPAAVSCRYCGHAPLWWLSGESGDWRLVSEQREVHECQQYREQTNVAE